MPRILYIGQTPAEGTGSPVIVLRHLQRLAAAGWHISIIAESGQDTSACTRAGWTVRTLPLRRSWWPPFRRDLPISRAVRIWLLAGECLHLTSEDRPDAVLGYLAAHDDFFPEIAIRYARRSGAPLTLLVHDDASAFAADLSERKRLRQHHEGLLRRVHCPWFVSSELAAVYGLHIPAHRVLPPIPSAWPEFVEWRSSFSESARVYYAGYIWPVQFPLLYRIALTLAEAGVALYLLTRETHELTAFLRNGLVRHVAPFATNREALDHLARHAAGILVSYTYTVAEMPWIATSFPSKLVEQAQLGVPCAIVAPAASAVGRWAVQAEYPDCFAPDELDRLASWARDLRVEASWRARADPVRRLAAGPFNPAKIQSTFADGLLRN